MAKRETDDIGATEPPQEWAKALVIENGRNWRSFFHHERMPKGWQASMIACAAQGMSEVEMMVNMQVTEPCWLRYKKNSKEFQELLGLCGNIAQAWFDKVGRENMSNPYFKEKLWAILVTARFGDPLKLANPNGHGGARQVAKQVPVDDERLAHLFEGGDGFPGEDDIAKKTT